MDHLSWLLVCVAPLAGCGAPMRNVPPALDPSNPSGPESAQVGPHSFGQPAPLRPTPPRMDEENMPGMQHGRQPDSGEQDMPGMQHDAMPGMQHGSSRKPTAEKPDQGGHAGMPGMEHGPQAPTEGKRPGMSSEENAGKHGAPKSPKPIYTCPMHREVKSDKPGRCPICGMKLEPESSGGTP